MGQRFSAHFVMKFPPQRGAGEKREGGNFRNKAHTTFDIINTKPLYRPIVPPCLKSAIIISFPFTNFTSAVSSAFGKELAKNRGDTPCLAACLPPGCADPKDYLRTRKAPTTTGERGTALIPQTKNVATAQPHGRSHWRKGLHHQFMC